ncbi:hypothetical protein DTO006G1_4548 [Penicillium roqueforti]|nr:hypothetical protein CBS147337_1016 [Penicillium roqueforti]KAI2689286.1 hypothetical protein LCP963914a_2375 [Penicillium roqueforti]KAI2760507.1 hypothetical protein DTO006G1_4548 [Penicillium roqueforti]KAI3142228.1 hypothetical protein CBS147330_15 [Penicillium roqueforti]KAI3210477.1 hypothetical protein CBS147311_1252 [Penicillium roqueforti]
MTRDNAGHPRDISLVSAAERERHVDTITTIRDLLSSTPYECSKIQQLSGGHLNLTYRGFLARPLSDESKSVIIKWSKDFETRIPGVKCLAIRGWHEHQTLEALSKDIVATTYHDGFTIRTPRPYIFFHQNVQVMEDLQGTSQLWEILSSAADDMSPAFAASLGYSIGSWLGSFHSPASKRGGDDYGLGENPTGRDVMCSFYLGMLEKKIETAPHIFGDMADQVRQIAADEIARRYEDCGMSLVHGDFSIRNLMISDIRQDNKHVTVGPIDWESSHYGRSDQDLGQVLGELYTMATVKGVKIANTILQHIILGYPALKEEAIFHTASYMGLMIITWSFLLIEGIKSEQEDALIGFARDLIVKGSQRDRAWLETTIVGHLFKKAQCAEKRDGLPGPRVAPDLPKVD